MKPASLAFVALLALAGTAAFAGDPGPGLLEFLGSVDSDDKGWRDYLAQQGAAPAGGARAIPVLGAKPAGGGSNSGASASGPSSSSSGGAGSGVAGGSSGAGAANQGSNGH